MRFDGHHEDHARDARNRKAVQYARGVESLGSHVKILTPCAWCGNERYASHLITLPQGWCYACSSTHARAIDAAYQHGFVLAANSRIFGGEKA